MIGGPTLKALHRYRDTLRRHSFSQLRSRLVNSLLRRMWPEPSWRPEGEVPVGNDLSRLAERLDWPVVSAGSDFDDEVSVRGDGGDIQDLHNDFRLRGGLCRCAEDGESGWRWVEARLVREYPRAVARYPMNVALRIRELAWVALLFAGRRKHSRSSSILAVLARHRRRLACTVENEIPGNHVLVERYALWMLDLVLGRSDADSRGSASRFEQEAVRNFGDDGVHVELSTHYQVQSLRLMEEYRRMVVLSETRGLSRRFLDCLAGAWNAMDSLRSPSGRLPRYGDGCYSFCGGVLDDDLRALDAARTGTLPDSADDASVPTLAALRTAPSLEIESPGEWRVFDRGGYLAHRFDAAGRSAHVTVDFGRLGLRRNPGHGHADAGAFTLDLDGRAVCVDSGTGRYDDAERWLRFKRARAHNTLWIAGEEPADLWRFFRWCDLPEPPRTDLRRTDDGFMLEVTRRGYGTRRGLCHRRRIVLEHEHGLRIVDEVSDRSAPLPDWGIAFHVAPGLDVAAVDGGIVVEHAGRVVLRIEIRSEGPIGLEAVPAPIAHDYGRIVRGTAVVATVPAGLGKGELVSSLGWDAVRTT